MNMALIRLSVLPLCGGVRMCVYIGITHTGSASPGLIGSKNINMIDGLLSLLLPGPRECVNVV